VVGSGGVGVSYRQICYGVSSRLKSRAFEGGIHHSLLFHRVRRFGAVEGKQEKTAAGCAGSAGGTRARLWGRDLPRWGGECALGQRC